MENPVYYLTSLTQIKGMNPYQKAASEIFIDESIQVELSGHIWDYLFIMISIFIILK